MNFPLTIPSAEPFLHVGDRVGCLIVHGFTGTPYEMRPLGDYLSKKVILCWVCAWLGMLLTPLTFPASAGETG